MLRQPSLSSSVEIHRGIVEEGEGHVSLDLSVFFITASWPTLRPTLRSRVQVRQAGDGQDRLQNINGVHTSSFSLSTENNIFII